MPIDPSIALGVRPVQLDNPLDVQAKQAQLSALLNQQRLQDMQIQQAQDAQRADMTLGEALRSGLGADGRLDRGRVLQTPGLRGSQIQGLQGKFLDEDKARAEIEYKGAQTKNQLSDAQRNELAMAKQRLDLVNAALASRLQQPNVTHEELIGDIVGLVQKGVIPPETGEQWVKTLPSRPESLRSFLMTTALQSLDAAKRLELQLPKVETRNMGGTDQVFRTNQLTAEVTPGEQFTKTATPGEVLSSADRAKALAQQAALAAAAREQSQRQFNASQNAAAQAVTYQQDASGNFVALPTKVAPGAAVTPMPVLGADGKPVQGRGKGAGPMSAALQKELLESDDAVQSGNAVLATLKAAKDINKKAYSGYFAKGRATLASNVPLIGKEGANATIDLDNMMTGQALESLKTTFGAAPTEGERKILLDMQASADKTPEQRAAIIDRAIAAAERRAKYAASKAKAIRAGTYLTDGIPEVPKPKAGNDGWSVEVVK